MSIFGGRPMGISGPGGYNRTIPPPTFPPMGGQMGGGPIPSQPIFGGGLAGGLPGDMSQGPMQQPMGMPPAPRGNMPPSRPRFMDRMKQGFKNPQFYQNLSAQLAGRFGGPRTQQSMPMPGPTPMPQMGGGQVPPPQMQPPMRRADLWR